MTTKIITIAEMLRWLRRTSKVSCQWMNKGSNNIPPCNCLMTQYLESMAIRDKKVGIFGTTVDGEYSFPFHDAFWEPLMNREPQDRKYTKKQAIARLVELRDKANL
jgi:hypothetical protein